MIAVRRPIDNGFFIFFSPQTGICSEYAEKSHKVAQLRILSSKLGRKEKPSAQVRGLNGMEAPVMGLAGLRI